MTEDNERSLVPIGTLDITVTQKILRTRTPKKLIKHRPGPHGMSLSYVSWPDVADKLDEAYGPGNWTFEYMLPPKVDNNEVLVGMRLILPTCKHEAYASHQYRSNNPNANWGDAVASASSKALRRCAARLGIARDLYQGDNGRDDEEDEPVVMARAALKSFQKTEGISDTEALDRLAVYYDEEKFKSFGQVLITIMNTLAIDGVPPDEPAAIWSLIFALKDNGTTRT